MAAAKKKLRIQASDVAVGNRTLEGVLIDLAEQTKANDARHAERTAQAEARMAQTDARLAQLAEQHAQVDARCARAEELATIALQTIAAVSQDLRALTLEFRAMAQRSDARLTALEKATAAE